MKFIDYLHEEFVNKLPSIHSLSHGKEYEVYRNPNSSDIHRLYKSIVNDASYSLRGLIDMNNRDFYVFSAHADLHLNAYNKLNKLKELNTSPSNIISFIGYIDDYKIWGETINTLNGENLIADNTKFDWLKKYIVNMDDLEMDKNKSFGKFK